MLYFYECFCILQCCAHVGVNDYTLHLLCHYADMESRNKLANARDVLLPEFLGVPENYQWFKSAMSSLLEKKGMPIEEYLVKLLKGAIPFDEGAILLFARATGLHFGVVLNDEFWCTNYDNDCKKWAGMMMYCGNLKFLDTTEGPMELQDCYELLNLNAFGLPHGTSPNPSTVSSPAHSSEETITVSEKSDAHGSDEDYIPPSKRRKPVKNRVCQLLPKVRKLISRKCSQKRSSNKQTTTTTVLTDIEDPPARCTRSSKHNKKPSAAQGKPPGNDEKEKSSDPTQEADKSTETPNKTDKSTDTENKTDKSSETENKTDKSNGTENKTDKSTETENKTDKSTEMENKTDKFNGSENKTDKSNGTENKTDKSTESDTEKSTDNKNDNSTDMNNEAAKSQANSNGVNATGRHATTGTLHIKDYGIKKTVTKERCHKCQHCDNSFALVKELNSHTREDHPDKPFKCHLCDRTYSSKNALDRHAKVHTGFPFVCGKCPFACQF